MLCIKTKQGYLPLENRDNFSIVYSYEGEQTLSFDLASTDPYFQYIKEGAKVKYEDNRYYITKINKRKSIVTVCAELDLNEWKTTIHRTFDMHDVLFSDVLLRMKPEDWTIEQAGIVKERFDISFEGVSDYDILMACKELYGIVFEYHIEEKRIKVIDPSVIQQRGLYLSEELNLDSVEYKGEYNVMVNRLYAYGKKTTIEESDGTTHEEYVTFASINNGLEYVDCMEYTPDEIICAYFHDDKVVDAQELFILAKERVKELAFPTQSWGCNIYDLSRTNEKYKHLDFKLYDKPILLVDGIKLLHQIVEYTSYPDQQHLNKVVLSTSFKKIQGEITSIKSNIGSLAKGFKVSETLINEMKQEVDSNTLRIENTYTKQEVDIKEESIIQQTNQYVDISLSEIDKKIEILDLSVIQLHVLKSGTLLNDEISTITLRAQIMQKNVDITDTLPDLSFTWQRISNNSVEDNNWNKNHKHRKEVVLSYSDIDVSASFQCVVETSSYIKHSGFETISDESDILKLSLQFDCNLPVTQSFNSKNEYVPSWNPLLITPILWNGKLDVPIKDCEVLWTRSDGNLQEGEAIEAGCLKVTKNVLDENLSRISYVCQVTYRTYSVRNTITFTLVKDGRDGIHGENGKTLYTWIQYSDDEQGTNMSDSPVGKKYIGISYNQEEELESDNPKDYVWSQLQGNSSAYESDTPPEDIQVLWFDTTTLKLKRWNEKDNIWEVINDNKDDIEDAEQRITETYNSIINQNVNEINVGVKYLNEKLGDSLQQLEGLQNEMILTKEETTFIKTTTDTLSNIVEGKVDTATIKEWARFDGSSLELGSSNSPFKACLTTEELSFLQGDTKVAWISNNELHIANSLIMEILRVGNWQCRDEGSAGLTWRRV